MYKIYAIKNRNNIVYIGKTKKELSERLLEHKNRCHNSELKVWLSNNINSKIVLLEEVSDELSRLKEREWTKKYSKLNLFNKYNNNMNNRRERYATTYKVSNKDTIDLKKLIKSFRE